jgi:hypothetical protein
MIAPLRKFNCRSGGSRRNPMKIPGPRRRVINENAIKFLIGASAIALPLIELGLAVFSDRSLESISASYAVDPWPRNYLVGFLFAMGTIMLTYNGQGELESWLAKVGGVAAFVVALIPGRYADGHFLIKGLPPELHGAATGVLFVVLIGFCFVFIDRARGKGTPESRRRIKLYVACGIGMLVSAGLLAFNAASAKTSPLLLWGNASASCLSESPG